MRVVLHFALNRKNTFEVLKHFNCGHFGEVESFQIKQSLLQQICLEVLS